MTTITVAIVTIVRLDSSSHSETTSSATAAITFISIPPDPNLHFNAPGQDFIGILSPNVWAQGFSWYSWDQKGTKILLGTTSADPSPTPVSINEAGMVSSSLPPTGPSSTTAPGSTRQTTPASTIQASVVNTTPMTPTTPMQNPTSQIPGTTETSTAQVPKPMGRESNGLSGGAVAGVAIGCLIAGALIAGLMIWLCLGNRKRFRARRSPSALVLMSAEKGFTAETIPLSSRVGKTTVHDSSLPQPLEDIAISGNISKINNSIKNHIQSYYHHKSVGSKSIDHDHIQALGNNPPISVEMLKTLLESSATREIALRFCLAWVIVSGMQPSKESTNSLLPPEVTQCLQGTMNADHSSKAHTLLVARWRVMTAELMQYTYVRNPFTASDSRNRSIRSAVSALDKILQPYADSSMDNEKRKRNLEEIVKRAALFAFTLFSQSSSWSFVWEEEKGVKSGELCIFPALVQTVDEAGERVKPPRPFSEAVVRRLDS